MTTDYSYYAVLTAGLLPYLFTALAKYGGSEPYNNHDPRAFLEKVSGRYRRAHNAQLNSFEAFPIFAIGVLIAHQKLSGIEGADFSTINLIAWSFVVTRCLYGLAYITDYANTRSLIWFIGLGLSASLYII